MTSCERGAADDPEVRLAAVRAEDELERGALPFDEHPPPRPKPGVSKKAGYEVWSRSPCVLVALADDDVGHGGVGWVGRAGRPTVARVKVAPHVGVPEAGSQSAQLDPSEGLLAHPVEPCTGSGQDLPDRARFAAYPEARAPGHAFRSSERPVFADQGQAKVASSRLSPPVRRWPGAGSVPRGSRSESRVPRPGRGTRRPRTPGSLAFNSRRPAV